MEFDTSSFSGYHMFMKGEDDVQDEEFVEENDSDNSATSIKKLRERLKKAIEEKQEYLDGWQRARAEFANYKKQEASFGSEKEERLKAELVERLLPALDALELARKHKDEPVLQMLERQFLESLKTFGVEKFGTAGDELDFKRYEPLKHIPVSDPKRDHKVDEVMRAGYRIGETIIRPAQVTIGMLREQK